MQLLQKPNHLASVCFKNPNRDQSSSKSGESEVLNQSTETETSKVEDVKNVYLDVGSSDDEYVFTLGASKRERHDVIVKIDGVEIPFMIDSGASCNILDSDTFNHLSQRVNVTLTPCSSNVYTYGSDSALQLRGSFYGNVSSGNTCILSKFIVPQGGRSGCLLGRETAQLLGLLQIHTANAIQHDDDGPPSKKVSELLSNYKDIMKGVGKLKDQQITFDIDQNVKPVSQHLRKTPFHVRKKVDAKLDELLGSDIIEPVLGTEATPWVSPVLAIPKGDDIRLVSDMREANRAIKRVHHPIPTVDETLEKYNKCTVFSKIDLKHGYFQLELAPESQYITTFSTHRGLFRMKRLVQGVNTAFELYQYRIGLLFNPS